MDRPGPPNQYFFKASQVVTAREGAVTRRNAIVAARDHNEFDDEREPMEDDAEWASEATGDRALQQQQDQQPISQCNPSSNWSWGQVQRSHAKKLPRWITTKWTIHHFS